MKQTIEVEGLGPFELEVLSGPPLSTHWYCMKQVDSDGNALNVVIYPDGDCLTAEYRKTIQNVYSSLTADHAGLLVDAKPAILKLFADYGLQPPADFTSFAKGLRLTHIKIPEDRTVDLYFGSCSLFPQFDLGVDLDSDGNASEVYFDG